MKNNVQYFSSNYDDDDGVLLCTSSVLLSSVSFFINIGPTVDCHNLWKLNLNTISQIGMAINRTKSPIADSIPGVSHFVVLSFAITLPISSLGKFKMNFHINSIHKKYSCNGDRQ